SFFVTLISKVHVGDCLFHAIRIGYVPVVELILENRRSVNAIIQDDNPYFSSGTTPMLLAACMDNYEIIKLLFKSGHRELQNDVQQGDRFHTAFESATKVQLGCSGKSSPSYITLLYTDPMQYCIEHIKDLRRQANVEYEYADFYKQLELQTEDFLCSLLDQIRSSEELADLFEYRYKSCDQKDCTSICLPSNNYRKAICKMQLLDDANSNRLLALAYMRYRNTPFLNDSSYARNSMMRCFLGILFPVLSVLYLISPYTKCGSLIVSPVVSFDCHMASDVAFVFIIVSNLITKDVDRHYLGSEPTTLEWIALLWILGKWVQEFEELYHRGWKSYFRDHWNHTDLVALLLMGLDYNKRATYEALYTVNATVPVPSPFEPRMIADGLFAWAYVFVFLRLLSLTRANRNLGPLQVTLSRMMGDVMRFLLIFFLVMIAFALGLSELYWVYGTPKGKIILCSFGSNQTVDQTCKKSTILFSGLWPSLKTLFWALFGHVDLTQLSLSNQHGFTEAIGRLLLAIYHAIAIIVILNMLIAMMSRSYQITSENEEREWKFHRTEMWIRYIRKEAIRPSPMNLIPHPHMV
uniref:Transient receptor ion channel domain-containing protein n=1 Tax=Ciona savignyi TaxID=51511 RepID=H2Z8F6_CIOSA